MEGKHKKTIQSPKLDPMDISLLCYQMSLSIRSGLNPVEGIPLITEEITHPIMRSSLIAISEKLAEGYQVHEAFEDTHCFPAYMVKMLEVGEKSGKLEAVFEKLSNHYENEAELKKRIKGALLYPTILALLMLGVIALLILKVIPMFGDILGNLGGQIPPEAQILFSITSQLKNSLVYIFLIIFIFILFSFVFAKTRHGKVYLDRLLVESPFSRGVYRNIIASRFALGLGLTLESGMSATESFDCVKGLINNVFVSRRIDEAAHMVSEGHSIEESIRSTKLFPELFVRMLRSAERSGEVDSTLSKLSRIYSTEAEMSLKRWSGIIEPSIVVILSIVMAVVLLAVLLPLIGIMSSIG